MAELAYKTWSLIPRDLAPPTQEPILRNPPLMPNLAIDAGATLQCDLGAGSAQLTVHLSVTALSAENRDGDFLQIWTGTAGALRAVTPSWSRSQDGPYVVLHADLGAAGPCVKFHLPEGPTLVVSAVAFEG